MDTPMTDYQLRFCPASYIHDSYMPLPLVALIGGLHCWREHPSINAWLLAELNLSVNYRVPTTLGGMAFYEQQALELTMRCLGGLLHGRAIRQLVDSVSLRRVHAAIGEAGHRYCLEQLELIIGHWPLGWQQSIPEGELGDHFLHCGLAFWLFAAGDVDEGFSRRLMLRLPFWPASVKWSFQSDQLSLAKALCLKVARHMSPTCFHLLK